MPYWAYDYPCRIDHESRDDEWRMPWLHCHQTYEIYLIDEGHSNVMIGDRLQWVSPGKVVLYSPMVLHRSVSRSAHSRWCLYFSREYLECYFTPEAIEEMLSCFQNSVVELDKSRLAALMDLMNSFLHAQTAGDSKRYMLLPPMLFLLSKGTAAKNTSADSSPSVVLAINYINENYTVIQSIDQVAKASYVSKEYLCRAFKKSTGYTVMQYLNNLRVNAAVELLHNTKKTVAEIAFECGFSSPTYFGYVFKEQMGETPRAFRKAVEQS